MIQQTHIQNFKLHMVLYFVIFWQNSYLTNFNKIIVIFSFRYVFLVICKIITFQRFPLISCYALTILKIEQVIGRDVFFQFSSCGVVHH